MRTDVKIGVVLSLVLVVAAGWYYLGRSPDESAIPLADESTASQADAGARAPAEQPMTIRRRDAAPKPPAVASSSDSVETRQPADRQSEGEPDAEPRVLGGPLAAGEPDRDEGPTERNPLANLLASGVDDDDADQPAPEQKVARPLAEPTERPTAGRSTDGPARQADSEPSGSLSRSRPGPGSHRTATATPRRPSHSPEPGNRSHVVGRGDTFAILAEVYYGSQRYTDVLIQANPQVQDPARLPVGTVLHIPPLGRTIAPARATASTAGTYLVQQGDSFYGIARKELGDANRWKELLDLNSALVDGDPKKLRPGQWLTLPTGAGGGDSK